MTILTLQYVCSRDKYVTNPVKKTAKTFFMRESTRQSDLSCIVVLLHELNSSTKWIAQRQCVHIARTRVLQRLQHQLSDINIFFCKKSSYISSLYQHDHLLIYWILYHVICIVNAFTFPQTLHHNPFSFKLFLVLPNFWESENACVDLLHELVFSCHYWHVSLNTSPS
jgi:hypothetical protein